MPFLRPGLTDLQRQALTDLQTAQGADGVSLLRRAVTRPLVWALAALAHGLYGYLDWISRQSVPWSAVDEYLEAWAALTGITRKPAVAFAARAGGTGSVTGRTVPAGTFLGAGGASYVTTADAVVDAAGGLSVQFTATITGSGMALGLGEMIALAAAIPGVNGNLTIAEILSPGVDPETDDFLRTRTLQRYAAPPQGGALTDYLEWALAVPGVTRAWVNPLGMGAGTVVIYTMFDIAEAAHGGFPQGSNGVAAGEARGTPATGDQLTVADSIYPLRPVTALVYSVSPVGFPVAFTIHPAAALTPATQATVVAAIDAAFIAYSTPLDAELETSVFETAIAAVPGMPDFTLLTPAAPIAAPLGYLPIRGSITYA